MMIEIEIKSYFSSDIDVSWWTPDLHEEVHFPVHMDIGEAGSESVNTFQVLIATPEGLRKHARGDVLSERATIVFADYSPKILKDTLTRIVNSCGGYDWDDSVRRLQRYFHWEYEDFR